MEGAPTPEHERKPRLITGLFRLSIYTTTSDNRVVVSSDIARFAIKEVPVAGWNEFSEQLTAHLVENGLELADNARGQAVAESPIDQLTESMEPGEIRLVGQEEYNVAYREKYGDAIYIPTFW